MLELFYGYTCMSKGLQVKRTISQMVLSEKVYTNLVLVIKATRSQ